MREDDRKSNSSLEDDEYNEVQVDLEVRKVLSDTKPLQRNVSDRIDTMQGHGSICFGGDLGPTNPGLSKPPIGLLRLPLSDDDALLLMDNSVAKTWQPEEIAFTNDRWESCLNRIVDKAAHELGIRDCNVRAQFQKMLLYGKGGMYDSYKNTEKAPGMFGTLLICLPSQHQGGTIHIRRGAEEGIYPSDVTSDFGASFIAWYTDVSHEVEPIRHGYQWMLSYSLIHDSKNQRFSATKLDEDTAAFVHILTEWENDPNLPYCLVYTFPHKYSPSNITIAHLREDDKDRFLQVSSYCTKHGAFFAFLTTLRMVETDENEHRESSCGTYLRGAVDSAGFNMSIKDSPIDPSAHLIQKQSYGARPPDREWEEVHHCYFEQWIDTKRAYIDGAIVLVRKSALASLLLGSNAPHETLRDLLIHIQARPDSSESPPSAELLKQVCWDAAALYSRNDSHLGHLAVVAATLHDSSLFAYILDQTVKGFKDEIYISMAFLVEDPILEPIYPVDEELVIKSLVKSGHLHRTYRNIDAFRRGYWKKFKAINQDPEQRNKDVLGRWLDSLLIQSLHKVTNAKRKDAKAVVNILLDRERDDIGRVFFSKGVTVFVNHCSSNKVFMNALLVQVLAHLDGPLISAIHRLKKLLEHIKEHAITTFDLVTHVKYIGKFICEQDDETYKKCGIPIRTLFLYLQSVEDKIALIRKVQTGLSTNCRYTTAYKDLHIYTLICAELVNIADASSKGVRDDIKRLVVSYITLMRGIELANSSDWNKEVDIPTICSGACDWCEIAFNAIENLGPITYKKLKVCFGPDYGKPLCHWLAQDGKEAAAGSTEKR